MQPDQCQYPDTALEFLACLEFINFVSEDYLYNLKLHTKSKAAFSEPALIFLPDFEILASPADVIDGFVSSLEIVVENILCILVKYLKKPN